MDADGYVVFDQNGDIVLDENAGMGFQVLVNPLVNWIWIGGGVLVLGGLIAFWPDRKRLPDSGQARARGK